MARKTNASGGGNSLITLGLLAVGGYVVYEYFFATPAAASTTTSTSGGGSTSGTSSGSTSGSATSKTPAVTLDSIYQAMLAGIANGGHAGGSPDPNFTGTGSGLTGTAYQFDVYLQLAYPGGTVPDPSVVFGSVSAASNTMTAAAYWAKMAPALQAANPSAGLSGLGMFGGLGAFMSGMGAYQW